MNDIIDPKDDRWNKTNQDDFDHHIKRYMDFSHIPHIKSETKGTDYQHTQSAQESRKSRP
jgi:hypothetical protein